jgi:hypothetical protein
MNSEPLQGFGNYDDYENESEVFMQEGPCLLKTKTDRYKEHWCVLNGNELYCYRKKEDSMNLKNNDNSPSKHRVMHSLINTFIKEMPAESSQSEACDLYPVKIVLPPNKSRLLYFKSQTLQAKWLECLRKVVGYANMFDYYNFEDNLGKG